MEVTSNPWQGIIGPVYTGEGLREVLGISERALAGAVREGRVLCVVAADGVALYPALQVRDGRIVPGLDRVLRELRGGFNSPVMWAEWLNTPTPRPAGGLRPRIDDLAAGHVEEIVEEARNTAAAWAG